MNNFIINDDSVLNLMKNDDGLFLTKEIYKNDNYYRFDFEIKNNKLNIIYISTNKKEVKTIEYEYSSNKAYIENDILNLDIKVNFSFYDGDSLDVEINNTFDLTKKTSQYRYDIFDKLDEKFALKYIEDLITTGQLYGKKEFVLNNIKNIFEVVKILEKKRYTQTLYNSTITVNKEDAIKMAQDFLYKNNININIRELIDDNTLSFKKEFNEKDEDGTSSFDEKQNKKIISVNETNNLLMPIVLTHEILHYTNQPNDNNRPNASEFLTEVVSYSYELIFLDNLLETEYKEDAIRLMNNVLHSLTSCAFFNYSPILSIKLMKENKKLDKRKIEEKLPIKDYINEMRECIMNKRIISKEVWNIIGFFLAIYSYIEYKKDNNFINKLFKLNNSLNEKTFVECLSIIDINSMNDILNKCMNNIDEFGNFIETHNITEFEKQKNI